MIRHFEDIDGNRHSFVTWSYVMRDFEKTRYKIDDLKYRIRNMENSIRRIMDTKTLDKSNCHKIIDMIFDEEFNPLHPLGYIDAAVYEERIMGIFDYDYNVKGLYQILSAMKDYEEYRAMITVYRQDIKKYIKHLKYVCSILGICSEFADDVIL